MTAEQIKQAVDAVLAAASLPLTGEDYERLLRNYPTIRAQLAELRLSEARYTEPAVVFQTQGCIGILRSSAVQR